MLALPVAGQQQESSAPASQSPSDSGSGQKKSAKQQKNTEQKRPSSAEQNPFPEAASEKAAQQAQRQENPSSSTEPNAPAPQQKKKSTAEQNPFPETQSEKAARQDQQEPEEEQKDQQQAPSPGPESSQPYSSSQDALKGLDLPGSNDSPSADGAGGTILNPDLARKDTKVGQFYLQTGDYQGAYDRFFEATRVDPTNANAVFGLAEASRHLNDRDQAIRNYRLYLSALPDGPHAKEARKALKDMGIEPKS